MKVSVDARGPLPAGVAARFTGALDVLGVADVLQILHMSNKSAVITITHNGADSWIWCSRGLIVDAQSGRVRGEPAVHRVFGMDQGWLVADLQAVSRPRKIHVATQPLLLEAARRKDESTAAYRRLGGARRRYRLADEPTQAGDAEASKVDASKVDASKVDASKVETDLLGSFAQARTVGKAVEASEIGELETLAAIERWVRGGRLVDGGLASGDRERATPVRPAPVAASLTPIETATPSLRPVSSRTLPRKPSARSPSRSWLLAACALLLLAPLTYRWGTDREPGSPARSTSGDHRVASSTGPDREERAEALHEPPPSADNGLDERQAAVRQLRTNLMLEATAPELHVTAPGLVPATLLFRDEPASFSVQLQSPPELASLPALEIEMRPPLALATAVETQSTARAAASTQPRAEPQAPSGRQSRSRAVSRHRRPQSRAAARPAAVEVAPPDEPRIQVIGGEDPLEGTPH